MAVRGGDPCGWICMIIAYLALGYADYVVVVWISTTFSTPWNYFHIALYNTVLSFCLCSHWRAVCTDPGIVPLVREEMTEYHGDDWTICTRCDIWRPPRAHHCRICRRCVRKMDHHCVWVNNCVGERNQKYFMQFLFWIGIQCVYSIGLIIHCWYASQDNSKHRPLPVHPTDSVALLTRQSRILHTVLLLMESILFGLFVVAIMMDQISALQRDTTAVEKAMIRSERKRKRSAGRRDEEELDSDDDQNRSKNSHSDWKDTCGDGPIFLWPFPCHSRRESKYKSQSPFRRTRSADSSPYSDRIV